MINLQERTKIFSEHAEVPKQSRFPRCKGCGIFFVPITGTQKYHSEQCKKDYYDKTFFSRATATKTCPNCGNLFETTKPLAQFYCSSNCREDASSKLHRKESLPFAKEAALSLKEFANVHPKRKPGYSILPEEGRMRAKLRVRRKYVGALHLKALYKRPYPENGICELCGRNSRRVSGHHWSDEEPSEGLYLCAYCHPFAELVDSGLVDRYLRLKQAETNRVNQLKGASISEIH